MFFHILIAFGFGNLAMLGWLAAAAAPLLIHLWSRHRFREAPWAAMQFLLAAMRKNARRLQLQQWLLLAVRTLILLLVVVAVAEPYGERLVAGSGSAPTHRILVIDGSYSMAYGEGDETRLARAKQAAAQLVRDSRPSDSFTVVLMSAPAKNIVGRESIDRAAVAARIEAIAQSHATADLPGALTIIDQTLNEPSRKEAVRHEVYFFTDLQRLTWQAASQDESAGSLTGRIDQLSKRAAVRLIDVGDRDAANIAVTDLGVTDAFVAADRDVAIDAMLHQFGGTTSAQRTVELLVDGAPVAEQPVRIAANEDAAVRFNHRFRAPGQLTVQVRASGVLLQIDNSRWLVVPVRDEVRVLCLAGEAGAARYVAKALNPHPAGDSPIRPVVVSSSDLPDIELSDYDCVFMCNVAQVPPGEADRLRRYVRSGGGLVFFLGNLVVADSYNRFAAGERPLLPAMLGVVVEQDRPGLDPLDYRHPIVVPFRGSERAGLLTTPVSRYFQLELPEDRPEIEIAAATRAGDPFIVAAPVGRGRTVVVATDASLASVDPVSGEPWTTWPTWPSFLPIVRELFAYATAGQRQQWQQPIGSPLTGHSIADSDRPSAAIASDLEVVRPDGETAPVSFQTAPSGLDWSYAETNLSGIYTVRGAADDARSFAINVDLAEGNLERIDERQLPPALQVHRTAIQNHQGAIEVARGGWHTPLLWAALSLMFVESFIAWQFGRGAL